MWDLGKICQTASQFQSDESGATAVEYSLIAAIMGIGIIVGLQTLQTAMDTSLTDTSTAVTGTQ